MFLRSEKMTCLIYFHLFEPVVVTNAWEFNIHELDPVVSFKIRYVSDQCKYEHARCSGVKIRNCRNKHTGHSIDVSVFKFAITPFRHVLSALRWKTKRERQRDNRHRTDYFFVTMSIVV